jgi:hypothetical protein
MKDCKASDASLSRRCNNGLNPRDSKNLYAFLYARTVAGPFQFGMGMASI